MNFNFVLHLIAAFIVFIFSAFVYFNNRKNTYFAVFGAVIFIWLFASSLAYIAQSKTNVLFWFKISYTGIVLIPITFYNFIFNLLGRKQKKIKFLCYIMTFSFIFILYFSPYLIDGLYEYPWGYYPKASLVGHPVFLLFFNIYFAISVIFIALSFRSRTDNLSASDKNRLKYVFAGSIFGALGAIDFLPNYGINVYPFGFIFMVIFPAIFAYAIVRYRLMDIYLAIKRTAAYSLSAGLLTAFFAILVITTTNLLSSFANVSSLKISVFAALLIAVLFNPLRNKIQTLIDKFFYKKTYDYYHTIQQVSSTLASMFDLDKIFQFVANVIIESMGLKNIYLLAGTQGGTFDVVYHTSSRKDKHIKKQEELEKSEEIKMNNLTEVTKYFELSHDIVIKDELSRIEELHGQDMSVRIKKELDALHGEVVVPVFVDKKLTLLLVLGEKMSGDTFTNEDINLLNTISVQTSIAIKNARLYQEKVNAEKLATLGMMSGTFAHEIRNPLTSLKTFAQLMPEKYNDLEFRDTFSKIVVGEIEKIDGLITDLLDFSSGKKPTLINDFNLTELVDEIVNYVKGKLEFEKSKITVEKHYNGGAIDMTGDARKLKQAFSNIIINGCQAMNNEGTLRVDIKHNGKYFDVIVEDTGKGIPPENLAKIFDPFITTKERGIGLGLAISKKVVEAHEGKIQVKSQPEKGTTFTISLPAQNA